MSGRIDYPPRTRAAIDEWMERKDKGAILDTQDTSMTISDGTPTSYERLRNAIPAQMYDTTGLRVGCVASHDNTECEYECHGCQNYYEEKDMGATYPHCRLKLRKREGCVEFRPTELYAMAMSIEWPPTEGLYAFDGRGDA